MKVTILHISDLHRDNRLEITNDALVQSLVNDMERYVADQDPIRHPDIVVVTGDFVRGVSLDTPNWESELDRQYAQAAEFLEKLTQEFVGGDRERVVLLPGNHDVCYPLTLKSMRQVTVLPDRIENLVESLFSSNSEFRWAWRSLQFYEIVDRLAYCDRFSHFCKFYTNFYNGCRAYTLDPASQFDVFDYPSFNTTFCGFNSCYNNDPLNREGAIHPDCIANATSTLRERPFRGRVLVAAWHHNTNGGPNSSDYMDPGILQVLIDSGFSVGLHGHQHKAQFIDEKFEFGASRKITVVCAGTLCGGSGSLPAGHSRSYNLLTLDLDSMKGRLDNRIMMNTNFGSPIWGAGRLSAAGKNFVEFDLQHPPQRLIASEMNDDLAVADQLISERRHAEAIPLLESHGASELAARLLLECYSVVDDSSSIVRKFYPPKSVTEILYVANALWSLQDKPRLRELLQSLEGHPDQTVAAMTRKYSGRI